MAANDRIFSPIVADNVDPLDIDPWPFVDDIGNVDGLRCGVAIESGLNLPEGIALLGHLDGQGFDRFLYLLDVVAFAWFCKQRTAERTDIQRRQRAFDIDEAKSVTRTLVDLKSDHKAALVAIKEATPARFYVSIRREDLDVRIAILEIELPEKFTVQSKTIGVVNIVVLEKAQPACAFGRNHKTQLGSAKRIVADKPDRLDLGLYPFSDLKNDFNPVAAKWNHLGAYLGVVEPLASEDVPNSLLVRLHAGLRVNRARL